MMKNWELKLSLHNLNVNDYATVTDWVPHPNIIFENNDSFQKSRDLCY